MNISARVEYACLAVMDLAESYGSGRPVQIPQNRADARHTLQVPCADLAAAERSGVGGQHARRTGRLRTGT